MLIGSLSNIICDPDIQCAGLIGHDVDVIGLATRHAFIIYNRVVFVMSSAAETSGYA